MATQPTKKKAPALKSRNQKIDIKAATIHVPPDQLVTITSNMFCLPFPQTLMSDWRYRERIWWWACQDLNLEPKSYEDFALPLSYRPTKSFSA
jgi:hypothetical protein